MIFIFCNIIEYTNWGSWADCSVTCGEGETTRTRQCATEICDEELSQSVKCTHRKCKGIHNCITISYFHFPFEICINYFNTDIYGSWSDWSPCSATCAKGIQYRSRACISASCSENEYEKISCFRPPCTQGNLCLYDLNRAH